MPKIEISERIENSIKELNFNRDQIVKKLTDSGVLEKYSDREGAIIKYLSELAKKRDQMFLSTMENIEDDIEEIDATQYGLEDISENDY